MLFMFFITFFKKNGIEIVRYAYDGISRLVHEDNKKATSYMLINFYIKSVFSNTFLFLPHLSLTPVFNFPSENVPAPPSPN